MSTSTHNGPKACQHPPASRYLDSDEIICRLCTTSLSFPPRPGTPDDHLELKRDIRTIAGEKHRVTPAQVAQEVQEVQVVHEVVQEVQDVEARFLACTCCHQLLPLDSFHNRNSRKAANRFFRSHKCRGCTAFQLRMKRQQNPELRERDRQRQARYQAGLTPEQRERQRLTRDKSENPSAVKRYQSRQRGIPVLIRAAGRVAVHVKPACRVAATCPLKIYCTVEVKGLV